VKTPTSRWRIYIEEEEILAGDLQPPSTGGKNRQLSVAGGGSVSGAPSGGSLSLSPSDRNIPLLSLASVDELSSLNRCLEHPTCAYYLNLFLRSEYSVENLLFIGEVRAFRAEAERLQTYARQIFNFFVAEDSINQVNVEHRQRRAVQENLARTALENVFAPVEKEVLSLLSKDSYPRFLRSAFCQRLLKQLSKERAERGLAALGGATSGPSTLHLEIKHEVEASLAHFTDAELEEMESAPLDLS
jgi:hypothetical protein